MSRSFYVDSLIIKDSSSRPAPSLPEPHPGPDFFLPLGMPSPLVMSVPGPGCASRKSGTFCVCPLCVTSHLHSSRAPGGPGGGGGGAGTGGTGAGGGSGGAAAGGSGALPLLKSQFSPGPGDAQFCPRGARTLARCPTASG
uniref:GS homeobox 2 n=1 Tax=Pipistrellus kuhlii TaxID=59472 RepID=A0A7J8B003_PIPKU|nr:GS homeobox 2 [Pipistrellus kuhlii]